MLSVPTNTHKCQEHPTHFRTLLTAILKSENYRPHWGIVFIFILFPFFSKYHISLWKMCVPNLRVLKILGVWTGFFRVSTWCKLIDDYKKCSYYGKYVVMLKELLQEVFYNVVCTISQCWPLKTPKTVLFKWNK